MKETKESIAELDADIADFVKNVFCIDGTVKVVHKHMRYDCYIKCNDKERGTFYVSFGDKK